MIVKESSWGSRVFPDIRISFCAAGRSRQLALSPPLQLAALAAMLAAGGSLAWLGAGRFADERAVAAKEAAVVRAESANADLQNDLAQLQDKLVATSRERAEAEGRLAGFADQAARLRGLLVDAQGKLDELEKKRDELVQENARMQQSAAPDAAAPPNAGRVAELSRALDEAQQDLHQAEAQRATVTARLSKTEADRAEEQARYARYQASLDETAKQLQQIKAERDRLRARIGELEQKLSERRAGRGKSMAGLGSFERALAATGINLARLLPRIRPDRAEGGPFVPPPKAGQATAGMTSDQLAAMRSLARSLPLAVPVDHYQIGSDFGSRRDPFNGRRSFHTGLDLDAPYDTPVYSTAPGTIVFAGYRGDYGKVVEIDHGNGVETRYAHLHRFVVSPGQRVEGHARIGYLGSTGRSSGPHVHYEVLVNGEAQDPEKFIGLARLLPGQDG
jgi:murein DD-endopeptidase MepM/ murein hydrolase activator NlpD